MNNIKIDQSVDVNLTSDEPIQNNSNNEQDPPNMFELSLLETETQTGSIPITWCIDKDWLEHNSNEPLYVLLCTVNTKYQAEWRGIAKLSDLAAYVTFLSPGENRIYGFVTNNEYKRDTWLLKTDDNFSTWSHSYFDKKYHVNKQLLLHFNSTAPYNFLDVNIPENCFAPEPSEIEKSWVNFFWRNKAVDQCEFRRRRLFAYTIQPLIFAVVSIAFLIVSLIVSLWYAMIGRIFNFKHLRQEISIYNIVEDIQTDNMIHFLSVKKFGKLSWLFIPVPWLLLITTVLYTKNPNFMHCKLLFLSVPIYLISIIVLGIVFPKIWDKINNYWDKMYGLKLERETQRNKQVISMVPTCSSERRIQKLQDLPLTTKSIKLRFDSAVTTKICKPFAK
jgi:hypothetical protein